MLTIVTGRILVSAGLAFALSLSTMWAFDIAVLTDSINNSLYLVSILIVGISYRKNVLTPSTVILAGSTFACALLFRSSNLALALPIIASTAILAAKGQRLIAQSIFMAFLFLAPVLLVWQAYSLWNWVRTDQWFYTTESVNALIPVVSSHHCSPDGSSLTNSPVLIDAYNAVTTRRGVQCEVKEPGGPISGSFDRRAPDSMGLILVPEMLKYLLAVKGLDSLKANRLAVRAYLNMLIYDPVSLARFTVQNLFPEAAFSMLNYVETLRLIVRGRAMPFYSKSVSRFLSGKTSDLELFIVGIGTLERALSFLFFIGMLLLAPIAMIAVRANGRSPQHDWRLGFLFLAAGAAPVLLYCMIHMEPRYLIVSQPFALLSTIWAVRRLRPRGRGLNWNMTRIRG